MQFNDRFSSSDQNFWEEFPQFTKLSIFKPFYTKDQSKSKNKTSKVMWYIALGADLDSMFYNLVGQEKEETLNDIVNLDVKAYLDKGNYTLEELTERFLFYTDTKLMAGIRALEAKFEERVAFIQSVPYTIEGQRIYDEETETYTTVSKGTAKQLDDMFANTTKIQAEIKKQRDMLSNSADVTSAGGSEMSFAERGLK